MIGLDTNVLVRYLVQDDPEQAASANEAVDRFSEDDPGFISLVVVVETTWVLARAYKSGRQAVASVIHGLLEAQEIALERADVVRRAVRRLEDGADFADAVVSELGTDAGCEFTVTFDRRAARAAGMTLLT